MLPLHFAGVKEIDIAASLEHIRDQRMGSVETKVQFEFTLSAISVWVHAVSHCWRGASFASGSALVASATTLNTESQRHHSQHWVPAPPLSTLSPSATTLNTESQYFTLNTESQYFTLNTESVFYSCCLNLLNELVF